VEHVGLIASLAALFAQVVLVVATIVRTKDKASAAQADATEALEKVALLRVEFMLYREKVASDLVSKDLLREFEDRLTKSIDRIVDRIDSLHDQNNPR
jgi:hypothetical protein